MRLVEVDANGKEIKGHGNMTPGLAKMKMAKMQEWFPGKLFEIRDGSADMGSLQSSGPHPTAMYSGDPGVRSSIREEMNGSGHTWELSEEEKFDIAEDG